MISIQEALDLIFQQSVPHHLVTRKVEDALHYFLAEDLVATMDLPSFDNSAMDGYAVCGPGPSFEIIDEIPAGDNRSLEQTTGVAYRIFTGARVPENCNAVIMQEKTKVDGKRLTVLDEINPGKNIRSKGEQIKKGQLVFASGQKINPSVIGLLTSFGLIEIKVFNLPKISLLTTGNELVKPGLPLDEGQLYESNGATIRAAAVQAGFNISEKEHVADNYEATKTAIKHHLKQADLLLVSGGISVGDHDHVEKAFKENGVEEVFYKVRQKPGKPLFFGRKGDTFVFGLPGNPASSLVCFYVYVVPLLLKLSGATNLQPNHIYLPLANDYEMPFDRPSFLKSRISAEGVNILNGQASSMLHSMATGNALVLLSEPGTYPKGTMVKCLLM